MVTKRLIKTIPLLNGRLYGTANTQRRLLGGCQPVIEIYRQDNPIKVLGRTSYALKSYHMALVLCGELDFAPGINYEMIQGITGYDLTADVLLCGGIIKELNFSDLYPEQIDPFEGWEFSTENHQQIGELLALNVEI